MNSKDIARYIGQNARLRRFGYAIIYITTLREWYIRREIERIMQDSSEILSVLDAGSGLGQHAMYIARHLPQANVEGLELDAEQVADCNDYAKKNNLANVHFKAQNIVDLDEENAHDLILCCSVLEHIDRDVETLRAFHRALRKSGTVLIYVPSCEKRVFRHLERKLNAMVDRSGQKFPHDHVRYYGPAELTAKLCHAGFIVEKTIVTYGPYGRVAYDMVTTIQYSKYAKVLLPFYLALIHPWVLLLMWADFTKLNKEGNGLLIMARKPVHTNEAKEQGE